MLPWRRRREADGEDPDYRFSLANERTFLAWIRTSLALLAGGVAVLQLVPANGAPAARHVLAIALVALGFVLAAASHRRWLGAERAMRLRRSLPVTGLIPLLGYGLAAVAVITLIFVLVAGLP